MNFKIFEEDWPDRPPASGHSDSHSTWSYKPESGHLHDLAVPLRQRSLDAGQRAETVQLYLAEWSLNQTGEKLGYAHTTIRKVLAQKE